MNISLRVFVLAASICSAEACFAQEGSFPSRGGKGAGYSTRDATVLSMMGWGVGLSTGIAVLCGLLHQSKASSGESGGGGEHTH